MKFTFTELGTQNNNKSGVELTAGKGGGKAGGGSLGGPGGEGGPPSSESIVLMF